MRIIDVPGHVPDVTDNLSNDALKSILEEIGIEYLVTLPESLYEVMLEEVIKDSPMKMIQFCREPEGISISSGLSYGGKKTAMLCSFKGLYNSVDSLLGTAVRTESSFLLLLSEAGHMTKGPKGTEGIYTEEILKAIEIPYYIVSSNAEIPKIREAWEQTKNSKKPVAVLLRW